MISKNTCKKEADHLAAPSMIENLKIAFTYHEFRKDKGEKSKFDGRLSPYWDQQFHDMFRGWEV